MIKKQKYAKPVLFRPKNPLKYGGDPTNIVLRSSYERRICEYLDQSKSCVHWKSEEIVVNYISPLDNKPHRYFVDNLATFQYPNGSKKTFLIEVKPFVQTQPPNCKGKSKKSAVQAISMWVVNEAKWKAATIYANQMGWEFKIVTEYDLGIKSR